MSTQVHRPCRLQGAIPLELWVVIPTPFFKETIFLQLILYE